MTAIKKKAYSPEQVVKLLRGVDAALAAGKTVEVDLPTVGGQ